MRGKPLVVDQVAAAMMKNGVAINSWLSHFVIAPPLIIEREQIDAARLVLRTQPGGLGGRRRLGACPTYSTCPSTKANASSSAATPASICSRSMISGGAITKWLSHELIATPFFIMAAAT